SSALSHLERARERGDVGAEAALLEVRASVLVAIQRGDLPTAQRALDDAVAASGWDTERRLLAAEIARRGGELQRAEAHLQDALRRDPHHPRALVGAASLALEVGDAEAAERFARDLVGRVPDASRGHSLLGEAL